MEESFILMLELYATFLFSLEYFLYKSEINSLEKVFIKMFKKYRKKIEKDLKYQKDILLKENKWKKALKIVFSLFILFILYKMFKIGYIDLSNIMKGFSLAIIIIIYILIIIPMKNYDYYLSLIILLLIKSTTKYLYSVKKGVIVGLGFSILLFSFIGKYLNIMDVTYPIVNVLSLSLVCFSMSLVILVIYSYLEMKSNNVSSNK